MKTCFQVLCLTGDSRYADYIEQSVYNALLGSINTTQTKNNKGLPFDSYSPLLPNKRGRETGGYKEMENGTYYGCCAAIGAAGTGLIPMASVMAARDGAAVNLYIDGKAELKTPEENLLTLNIDTDYPVSGKINIKIKLDKKEKFTIYLRIPSWSEETGATVNGNAIKGIQKGEYLRLEREWADGDSISISFDMKTKLLHALKYEEDPEAEYHVALKRGPVILARDARFGEDVGETVDIANEMDIVSVINSSDAKFPALIEFKVPLKDGGSFHAVNYSSAGKTWDFDSKMAAWLPIRH
jgi:DUF1680 family protein